MRGKPEDLSYAMEVALTGQTRLRRKIMDFQGLGGPWRPGNPSVGPGRPGNRAATHPKPNLPPKRNLQRPRPGCKIQYSKDSAQTKIPKFGPDRNSRFGPRPQFQNWVGPAGACNSRSPEPQPAACTPQHTHKSTGITTTDGNPQAHDSPRPERQTQPASASPSDEAVHYATSKATCKPSESHEPDQRQRQPRRT